MHLPARIQPLVPVFGVLAAASLAIWPTWSPLVGTWREMADYAQGPWIVLAVLGWIIYRGADLPRAARRLSVAAAASLLAATVAWLVAFRAASNIGQQIMLPIVLWCATWLACGLPVARRLAAPLACLYFAIPAWELLLPALQWMTVAVSQTLLGWLGVPVAIDGSFVTIPEGTFHIIEGCAGKRYFMVSIEVAALLVGTLRLRLPQAAALLAITAALALVTNWIRVMIVIYAGHVTDMTSYLIVHEHLSLGWIMFGLMVLVICLIARRFSTRDPPADAPGARVPLSLGHWAAHPAAVAALLLLCLPATAVFYSRSVLAAATAWPAADPPLLAASGGWLGPTPPDILWSPQYRGAAAERRAAYRGADGTVELFVASYRGERLGAKLVSTSNSLLSPKWVVIVKGTLSRAPTRSAAPRTIEALSPTEQRWLVSYLYQVDDAVTASPVVAQLVYGLRSWERPVGARVIAAATRCTGSCGAAQRNLADFWSELGAQLLTRPAS